MGAVEVFGRYELITLAGSGGMALVHLARQRGPEGFVKPCVLKRIAPEAHRHEAVRRMFLEEARVSALLNHPNIVQTFDYGAVDGVPYMAMELIDGVNLAQFCRTLAQRKRWLPVQPAVEICLKLLDALQYAHELVDLDGRPLRLVHRDVSPQNTLLSRQGVIKLADFGIARHEARDEHTRIGETAKGKPGYMAPEQAMGEGVDGRADIFSVGILLTELISARRVMAQNERPVGVLGISNRIRDLFAYRPEAPRDLEEVAQRMCALDPAYRPATASQAAAELRLAMSGQPSGQPVEQFLKQVFQQHIQGNTLGAALNQGTGGSPAPPPPIATPRPSSAARPPHPGAGPFGNDPTEGQLPARAAEPPGAADQNARTAWERPVHPPQDDRTTPHHEGGWPTQFLTENAPKETPAQEPQIELVARSSGVEAMQYFAAEESEEVKQRRRDAGLAAPPPATPGHPPATPGHPPAPSGASSLPLPGPAPATPLTLPGPGPAGPAAGSAPINDPNLSNFLSNLQAPGAEAAARGGARPVAPIRISPLVQLGLGGLAVLIVGLIVVTTFSRQEDTAEGTKPVVPATGQLTITSSPPNARILIDRQDTGQSTPKTFNDLAVDLPIRVSVALPGHKSIPRDLILKIPALTAQTSAHFTLKPGLMITVKSVPPGAYVTLNDERMADVTPVKLDVIPFGETATVTLEHDGYLPHRMVVEAKKGGPSVAEAKLEPAVGTDILSEPPGAKGFIDGVPQGKTPAYDLQVPRKRRYRVTLEKVGFKRWTKRMRAPKESDGPLVVKLKNVPFMKLPMSLDDRERAKQLQRDVSRLRRSVRQIRAQLKQALYRLERLESMATAGIGPLAQAQRKVDLLREALANREEQLAEAKSKQEVFRDRILLNAELEN